VLLLAAQNFRFLEVKGDARESQRSVWLGSRCGQAEPLMADITGTHIHYWQLYRCPRTIGFYALLSLTVSRSFRRSYVVLLATLKWIYGLKLTKTLLLLLLLLFIPSGVRLSHLVLWPVVSAPDDK
jgi:hypothetical protein